MDKSQLSYTYNANGYMLTYRGQPLGGAGVGPRSAPLHWRHAAANRKQFAENAQNQINAIVAGHGEPRFMRVIAEIDAATTSQQRS